MPGPMSSSLNQTLSQMSAADLAEALLEEITLEKQAAVAAEFDRIHSVERARDVGSLNEIIEPARLRERLIASLCRAIDPGPG